MVTTTEIRWMIIEGYLSHLSELNAVGGAVNYMPIQFLVMHLVSGGNIMSLTPELFRKIGEAYPSAVEIVVGDRKNLDNINIPQINLKNDRNRLGDIWSALPEESKEKIHGIFYNVKQMIGA